MKEILHSFLINVDLDIYSRRAKTKAIHGILNGSIEIVFQRLNNYPNITIN